MFPNKAGALFPNQFVNIVLLVDTLKNQVVVPTTATRHGPQGDFVWVLQPDHTVKVRLVKVGPGTPETVSIVSGLNVGESVITDGGDRLQDGASVILPGAGGKGGGGKGSHGRHGAAPDAPPPGAPEAANQADQAPGPQPAHHRPGGGQGQGKPGAAPAANGGGGPAGA